MVGVALVWNVRRPCVMRESRITQNMKVRKLEMKYKIDLLGILMVVAITGNAQTQLSTDDLNTLYTTQDGSWVSIHDPSVVFRNGNFHIWGSHLGIASSKDLVTFSPITAGSSTFRKLSAQGDATGTACTYADAFSIQQVTQVKNANGEMVPMPNFDAAAY